MALVTAKWRTDYIVETATAAAVLAATDVVQAAGVAARQRTPLKHGWLRSSYRIMPFAKGVGMSVGGVSAPYGEYQERGYGPWPDYRRYRRYTTPGTGAHFMRDAFRHWVGNDRVGIPVRSWAKAHIQSEVRRTLRMMP